MGTVDQAMVVRTPVFVPIKAAADVDPEPLGMAADYADEVRPALEVLPDVHAVQLTRPGHDVDGQARGALVLRLPRHAVERCPAFGEQSLLILQGPGAVDHREVVVLNHRVADALQVFVAGFEVAQAARAESVHAQG